MSCNVPSLSFAELSSDPVSPSTGRLKLYAKSDGKLYVKDDAGSVSLVSPELGESLSSIQSLTVPANSFLYTTAQNTFSSSTITALGRNLLDDSTQAAMLTTLGAANSGVNQDITQFQNPITFIDSILFSAAITLQAELFDGTNSPGSDGDILCSTGLVTEWRQFVTIGGSGGPTITSGSGVPAAAEPDGSIYLRSGSPNGSLYVRENGVWQIK